MRHAIVFFLVATLSSPVIAAPRLSGPVDLTDPHPASILLTGAAPRSLVEILTSRRDVELGKTLEASATFRADAHGNVNVNRTAPVSGTYRGVEPLGLFWSASARPSTANDPADGKVSIIALTAGRTIATIAVRSRPDNTRLSVRTDTPFPGAVFVTPGLPGVYPVIIVLGGSEGGSSTARMLAPLFAARGYATLGLPYYNPGYDPNDLTPGLPTDFSDIPVDRLGTVRDWLSQQHCINIERVGIWGASKGAEFALIAATKFSWIKAVAAIVPSDLVWEGWGQSGPTTSSFAFNGKSLAYQPYAGMQTELAKAAKGQAMDLRRVHMGGRLAFPKSVAAARIPIENYRGALLVAGGGRDTIWPSAEMATNIVATRRRANLPTILLTYPDAGHLLGGPGTSPFEEITGAGGEATAMAHARGEVWARTIDMFDAILKR